MASCADFACNPRAGQEISAKGTNNSLQPALSEPGRGHCTTADFQGPPKLPSIEPLTRDLTADSLCFSWSSPTSDRPLDFCPFYMSLYPLSFYHNIAATTNPIVHLIYTSTPSLDGSQPMTKDPTLQVQGYTENIHDVLSSSCLPRKNQHNAPSVPPQRTCTDRT